MALLVFLYILKKGSDKMSELYHHGIKGQKWGVRNGPPYPLYSNGRLGRAEQLTSQVLNKYKNQYNNLKHVKIADNTNGRIYTKKTEKWLL